MSRSSRIPQPELRGITLAQLRNVRREIDLRCKVEEWTREYGGSETIYLRPEEVNLYDLNAHLIIPQTQADQCSYVELIASGPQPPDWFVSHWWGEPVHDFLKCLEQHAFDRNLGSDTSYWVCAYANNQHNLEEEVGDPDLRRSSFYRAMGSAKGVVSIVDKNSIVFSRVWCTFEISIALRNLAHEGRDLDLDHASAATATASASDGKELEIDKEAGSSRSDATKKSQTDPERPRCLYDIYTHSGDGRYSVGLTDGVVAADMYPRKNDGSLDTDAQTFESNFNGMQTIRQANFPQELCEKGLSICLETAEASVEMDRKKILNFVSGNINAQEDDEPPETHASYTYINNLLRSKFAIAAYRRRLEEGKDVENVRNALSEAPIEDLQLSFHGTRQFKEEAPLFTKSLPTSLKRIDLKFTMQLFKTSAEFAKGFGRLQRLESFKLNCSTCTLTSCTDLWEEIAKLGKLRDLDLNFSYNQYMSSIDGLGKAIVELGELRFLKLNFSQCSNITSIEELLNGIVMFQRGKYDTSLRLLDLNFKSSGLSEESRKRFIEGLCSATIPFKPTRIHLNFEPEFQLQSVTNIDDLNKALRSSRCPCEECVVS
mmetsp:Transcript_15830/g.23806  ORF Transcript_15830/g.23806 Transcript_15830/m.23806 type:complete len:601 (+) Transcript_15830:169-1971(+)|eukprot:CAMPEP_0203674050 /NCGR_PEP_ID=MMETSP0090-20130426/14670_1 /ASSEMBLY_ACC=CAM_ASM_001088 /TAXON_ID=426623 /ORGANISM="Chaetoceros affinis, Strain CCMP159" /LENGTH=600 /DNA_ID=CAMNT_0050539823 /DNA_START=102 /DNA_END=1904 /DNA_ORIENTATION=+